ncbi:MAG: AraC family transcriptional regulator [Gammaproteobacteria bacterium]|nr:AraC family transcriptional regulator [Gammaproteobacteria bacterium]
MDNFTKKPVTSSWPLSELAHRVLVPNAQISAYQRDPLCRTCYPVGVGYYPRAHNHQMARERPSDQLIVYCTEGEGTVEIDRRKFKISEGDVALLPAGVPHSYRSSRHNPWSIYWAHFSGSDSHLFLSRISAKFGKRPIGVHGNLIEQFGKLMTIENFGEDTRRFMVAAQQLRVLLGLIIEYRHHQGVPNPLAKLDSYMASHLSEKVSLADMSSVLGMSNTRFCEFFKRQRGERPMAYFNRLKIERAKFLLEQSDLSVREVGEAIGWQDPYYFSRVFKRYTGQSPRAYRNT